MNISLSRIPKPARFATGAVLGLLVAGAVVAVTAFATGFRLGGPAAPSVAVAAAPSPTPSAAPSPRASGAQATSRRAIVMAEAQVLGIKAKDLTADVKNGQTVSQLAQQKGLSEDQFRAALIKAVQASSLPSATER